LARQNLAASDVADRIELHAQRIEDLDETSVFTVAWLPGPFLDADVADRAIAVMRRALAPGGWLIFGVMAASGEPLGETLNRLRIVRSGGYPWTTGEVEERLHKHEFTQIGTFAPQLPIRLVTGQREG